MTTVTIIVVVDLALLEALQGTLSTEAAAALMSMMSIVMAAAALIELVLRSTGASTAMALSTVTVAAYATELENHTEVESQGDRSLQILPLVILTEIMAIGLDSTTLHKITPGPQ